MRKATPATAKQDALAKTAKLVSCSQIKHTDIVAAKLNINVKNITTLHYTLHRTTLHLSIVS